MCPARKVRRDFDGFVFAYEISRTHFSLKLFRVLPLGRVALRDIKYIRQRSGSDMTKLMVDAFLHPLRRWYWPHTLRANAGLRSSPYIIMTVRDTKIYVRLKTGFHYRLRAAMGEARSVSADAVRAQLRSAAAASTTAAGGPAVK